MRLFPTFWVLLCGAFTLALGGEQKSDSHQEYNTAITTCEDLPSEITGTVLVLAPIICEAKKTVTVSGVASFHAGTALFLKNVHFEVPPDSTAFFAGRSLSFERDEETSTWIFEVYGNLIFYADGHDSLEGSPEDEYGMIKQHPGCKVISEGQITYTKSGIKAAAGVPKAGDEDDTAASHAEATPSPATPVPADTTVTVPVTVTADTTVTVPGVRWDSRWARRSQAGRKAEPVETPPLDESPTIAADSSLEHPWFGALLTESRESLKVGQALTSPASLHASFFGTLGLALDGSVIHKRPAAGEELNAGIKEAMVQKLCPLCSWDVDIGGTATATELAEVIGKSDIAAESVSLLTTKTKDFAKVMKKRRIQMYKLERARKKRRDVNTTLEEAQMQEADARMLVKDFTSTLRITDRGYVEAFVDGVKVISESGRKYEVKPQKKKWFTNPLKALKAAFARRKKSNEYELHVVEDGIEIRLGKELVWAIRVA